MKNLTIKLYRCTGFLVCLNSFMFLAQPSRASQSSATAKSKPVKVAALQTGESNQTDSTRRTGGPAKALPMIWHISDGSGQNKAPDPFIYFEKHVGSNADYQGYTQKLSTVGKTVLVFDVDANGDIKNIKVTDNTAGKRSVFLVDALKSYPVNWPVPKAGRYQMATDFQKQNESVNAHFKFQQI